MKLHNSVHQWAILPEMESKKTLHYQHQQVGSTGEPQTSPAVHFFPGCEKLAPKDRTLSVRKQETPNKNLFFLKSIFKTRIFYFLGKK